VELKIYNYRKDKENFSDLFVLLKDYEDDSMFYNYYELNKTSKTINIQRVNNLGNIILPTMGSIVLILITLGAFIYLISGYDSERLGAFIISLLLTLGWISLPSSEVFGSHELHYFNTVEKVYISKENEEISFDDIYGFFIEYTLVQNSIEGPASTDCYKLNMILNSGKIIHIIAELYEKGDLLEDAKIVASCIEKPLYHFDTDTNVYLLSLASQVKIMNPSSQQHKKQNS